MLFFDGHSRDGEMFEGGCFDFRVQDVQTNDWNVVDFVDRWDVRLMLAEVLNFDSTRGKNRFGT